MYVYLPHCLRVVKVFRSALAASDIRNLVETVNSLPRGYSSRLDIILNNSNAIILNRIFLILRPFITRSIDWGISKVDISCTPPVYPKPKQHMCDTALTLSTEGAQQQGDVIPENSEDKGRRKTVLRVSTASRRHRTPPGPRNVFLYI